MKKKYTIKLFDMSVTVVSDKDDAAVHALESTLNARLTDLLLKSKYLSKTEAALFCALDYLEQFQDAKQKLDKTQAQLELYANNLTRVKEENAQLSKKVDMLEAKQKHR